MHEISRPLRLADPLRPCRNQVHLALPKRFMHRPKDEDIKHNRVQVVNAEGKLEPPIPLATILASLDRKKYFVQLVTDNQPIVKILDKQEAYKKAKALKRAKKAADRGPEEKEIQMTWGVATGDLSHKMDKVRTELEKKNRVSLIFAPKKGQPVPPPNERDEKMNEILEMLKDIGQESRPRTVLRSHLTLHLEARRTNTI